jgi:hypothetical protein
MPEGTRWTRPQGGMFIWVNLPEGIDGAELLQEAISAGVAFVPGGAFFASDKQPNTLRLNFTLCKPEVIRDGIARLGGSLLPKQSAENCPCLTARLAAAGGLSSRSSFAGLLAGFFARSFFGRCLGAFCSRFFLWRALRAARALPPLGRPIRPPLRPTPDRSRPNRFRALRGSRASHQEPDHRGCAATRLSNDFPLAERAKRAVARSYETEAARPRKSLAVDAVMKIYEFLFTARLDAKSHDIESGHPNLPLNSSNDDDGNYPLVPLVSC